MNLIYQYWEGEMPWVIEVCTMAMKAYAARIGADYMLAHKSSFGYNPYIRALDGFVNPDYDKYDNVVVVDCDVIPKKNLEESVFSVPGHCALPDEKEETRMKMKRKAKGKTIYDKIISNGGIYKMTCEERRKAQQVLPSLVHLYRNEHGEKHHEEDLMHWVWYWAEIDATDMGCAWNYCPRGRHLLHRDKAKFHHLVYNGTKEESYKAIRDLV